MSTLLKTNGRMPSSSFFDDFWTRDFFEPFEKDWSGQRNGISYTVPKVNIIETNDDFQVEMAAPGMLKEDFHIDLENDNLIIWSELSDSQGDQESDFKYTRREFGYNAFKRSFYLPNTVETDKIQAKYKDGILFLTIPKKDEAKRKASRIIPVG